MTCCKDWEQAMEGRPNNTIRLIDSYDDDEGTISLKKGLYLIDLYVSDELGKTNYPAVLSPIKFCPWCGKEVQK